jgi:inner membrane protein
MTGQTHIIGGITSYLFYTSITGNTRGAIIGTIVAGVASLLPDIDQKQSSAGKLLLPLSWAWDKCRMLARKTKTKYDDKIFEHRGITHTLVVPVLLLILWALNGYSNIVMGALIGWMSHILLDLNNDKGVPIFFPCTWKKFHILTITTGGKKQRGKKKYINVENVVFWAMWGVSGVLITEILRK